MSAAYERGRPSYPAPAVQRLCAELRLAPGGTVVDLAAGTGKFTRLLPPGLRVIAVEPVDGMRAKLVEQCPGVEAFTGTAESMPLPSGSADAVVVAQAFHWFDGPKALAEIHRVLRPGGRLGLVWNVRDLRVDWMQEISELLRPFVQGTPGVATGEWRKAFEATTLFAPLATAQFPYEQAGDAAMIIERFTSVSYIASLPQAERDGFIAALRQVVERRERSLAGAPLALPYVTEIYWTERC